MKVARAVESEAMNAKRLELLFAPPIEMRVVMGEGLVLHVFVKVVSDVALEDEPCCCCCCISSLYVMLLGTTKA